MNRASASPARHVLALATLSGSLLAAGCGGEESPGATSTPEQPAEGLPLLGSDCDPMVPTFCGLPFPSNVYLLDDPTGKNPSGKSVRFGPTTLPARTLDGEHFPADLLYDHDGFSPSQAPMTHLPLARCDDCATPYDIEKSLADDHPTVLIEAETGQRVAHWVDIDQSTPNDGIDERPDERLLMIRPAARRKDATRYLVAIRGVTDSSGAPIAPSPVFEALRAGKLLSEGTPAERWTVYARRELYADVFTRLEAASVPRDTLQIAWDFTTATRESNTSPMLEMRDKALAVVGGDGPSFTFVSTEEFATPAQSEDLLRRIHLRMTVPLYLTSGDPEYSKDKPIGRLNFGANGELEQNGTMEMDVIVLVPRSVETAGKPHGLLQNGHGLFGSRFEGQGGYLARAANRNRWIAFSINLFGFDEDAVPFATNGLLGRFEALKGFSERQIQGMVNQLLAMRMMMGRVAKDGITDGQGKVLLDPQWLDPSVRGYRGDSQGGIMGGTYMSVSTDVTRGLLGEPGSPYNLLLNRSVDYGGFALMMEAGFGFNGVSSQLVLGVIQMSWDRAEPSGFVPYLEKDMLPGTPAHHVLLHVARGDHQVSTFGAHSMARSIGAAQLASDDASQAVWEPIWGLEQVTAPVTDRSVLVEYEFGLKPNPAINRANEDGCDPHDRVRDLAASYDQQDEFFRTGAIGWYCKGACNCDDEGSDPNEEDRCDETFASQCE